MTLSSDLVSYDFVLQQVVSTATAGASASNNAQIVMATPELASRLKETPFGFIDMAAKLKVSKTY